MGLEKVEQGAYILLVIVVLGVVLTIVVGITYNNYANNQAQINTQTNTLVTSSKFAFTVPQNGMNDNSVNALVLNLGGSYSWISATNPLTLTITGNRITTFATNAASAVSTAAQTQVYTITSATTPQTLGASAGNFFNFTSITVTVPWQAYPSFTANVVQSFTSVTPGPNLGVNSISGVATGSASYTYPPALANFTQNGGSIANTGGSNTNYVYYILFAALIIGIIIGVLVSVAKAKT